ncbi:MAG TPA: phospho-N-acetylmuramoyl-pentapeptide-transferase [Methylomirabilota bacterium]|jgi:phospho-N-acetylmuramoyl-pentapeptide-transferase|nr:phospho-N-acetylmuramoyl-pentapeptide-transferase [Methylomirabilota bacterium]
MLTSLAAFAKYHIAFNVFRYITFRTAMAMLTALLICLVVGPWVIRKLRDLQIGETIRVDGPERHRTKAGTPTMGGLLILGALFSAALLWGNLQNRYVWVVLVVTALLAAIGFYDDWLKLRRARPLKIREKFALQAAVGLGLGAYLYRYPSDGVTTQLVVPFAKEWVPDLGTYYVFFVALIVVGASNAVNLTDGLDGLAMGPVIVAAVALGIFSYVTGHARLSEYLFILKVKGAGELAVFCGALMGASVGFLWFNSHPAEVFMGDVGSLALGGALGTLAVLVKAELLLPFIGGLFVVEAVSVILQVASYRTTGRRIFRMAPLHHHFELAGWPESKIVIRFWILSLLMALMAVTTLKLR